MVLLDRDGVLNIDLPGSVRSLSQLQIIEDAPRAVATICAKGYVVAVVTNQAVVARGLLSQGDLDRINGFIGERVEEAGGRIDRWYVCVHDDIAACPCRKPRPGLLRMAQAEYGFIPSQTWFLGDASRDVEAALAAGCRPGIVLTGKGKETRILHPGVDTFASLGEFADQIPWTG